MRTASLPAVFARYSGRVSYVAQRGANEYSSTCPTCGGTAHDKDWPDRCRWFTEGKPRGWCRQCGAIFWPDDAIASRVSTAEQEAWRREREAAEVRRKAEAERALANLRQEKVWLQYVELMDEAARKWWEGRGVPRDWQTHLQLGYTPSKTYRDTEGALHTAPAYTIPYFGAGFEFVTMQYRVSTDDPATRYRFHPGLPTAHYLTEPQKPTSEQVIICEGATKAIVTAVWMPENYTVLAIPSKADFAGVVGAVAEAQRVYVLLDPDAGGRARKLAAAIGAAARVVELPVKVDDGFTRHGLTAKLLQAAMGTGRPV